MGNTWGNNENSDRLYFLGSKTTADGDCSRATERHLLLRRKAMINFDSILKSRDITLPTKICLVKAMVFPVVVYRCESWTIKKAECRRIDAFELWCWRRLLRVPWTARRSNQSILKEINPKCLLEGLMLKLKLQYFWPPDAKNWLIRKDPDAVKYWKQEKKRTTEDEMVGWHHWLDGHEFEQAPGVDDGQVSLLCCSPRGHKVLDMSEQLKGPESLPKITSYIYHLWSSPPPKSRIHRGKMMCVSQDAMSSCLEQCLVLNWGSFIVKWMSRSLKSITDELSSRIYVHQRSHLRSCRFVPMVFPKSL